MHTIATVLLKIYVDLRKGVFNTHAVFWLWKTITWCLSKIQAWNFYQFLHYVSALNCKICWPITFTHLKLWIVEVYKSDVCGRPLLQIWSHTYMHSTKYNMQLWNTILEKNICNTIMWKCDLSLHVVWCGLTVLYQIEMWIDLGDMWMLNAMWIAIDDIWIVIMLKCELLILNFELCENCKCSIIKC